MASEDLREIFKHHRDSQDKYSYFLLAAAGGAIAVAVNQTLAASLSWSQMPLAVAVLSWGSSFFFGCRQLTYVQSALFANVAVLQLHQGSHPNQPQHPQLVAAASEGVRIAFERNSEQASRYANLQFRFLVVGAISYLGWHVLEMYLRGI